MLNIEYNLLNYNNYNGILKYLNISNKIYLQSIEEILIEKSNNASTNASTNTSNSNTSTNTSSSNANVCDTSELNQTLTIEENMEIDLVDLEHSIISNTSNFKTSKEYNISAKEILVNKYFNKLNMLININMQKSINWCKKHNFTVNKEFLSE